ncbi:MAG: hypothetical protein ACE3JK_07320 [Sporolactobacillus sp.]
MALSKKVIFTTIAGISVSFVLTSCSTADNNTSSQSSQPQSSISQSSSSSSISSSQSSDVSDVSKYKNGVYRAIGKYGSLPSSITVNVTLVDGVIKNVRVTPHATNATSLDFQRRFASAVPKAVVGKRIDQVRVGKLAGSSGTPDGFNAAIQRIKSDAQTGQSSSK